MYPNLRAEMAMFNIKPKDIAKLLNISRQAVSSKMLGQPPFTLAEAFQIRDKFFPKMSLDILFSRDILEWNKPSEIIPLNIIKQMKKR